ncbi:hypothetical protein F5Y11DRAFT_344314 [Daldinia sp. FL1419]|nr:hypothetical protein F5Y11DRAFT_344314 [Daldinia sp. FL1419]
MAPRNRVNFKNYETSTRLLAAVVASLEGKVKLDFDVISLLVGGGTTESAVEHRMRPIKQLGKLQIDYLMNKRRDPGLLPTESGEIQKLFGESTPAGIAWQVREIKALGRAQRQAVAEGKNPWEVKVETAKASTASTPTSRGGRTPSTAASSTKRKRVVNKKVTMSEEDTGIESTETDYDAKDFHSDGDDIHQITPTPKRRNTAAAPKTANASSAATPTSAKGNGNNGGVARSLFGDGIKPARPNNSNGVDVQFVDLSEDTPSPPATASGNISQVKADPDSDLVPEEITPNRENQSNHFVGDSGVFDDDDLAEGEC